MSPLFGHVLLLTIVALSILLMLVRPRNIPEVWWVGSGALLLVALRLIPVGLAEKAVLEGSDVYLFLIGMMLLSELGSEYGSSTGSLPSRRVERRGNARDSSS